MKIADALNGVSRLCIETAPFIYFVEAHPGYVARMRECFRVIEAEAIDIVTSTITLSEVLTKPLKVGDTDLETAYRDLLLKTRLVDLIAITVPIAERTARLRATYNLKTPDALQLATALVSGCDAFLTNDRGLQRVTEIQVLLVDDLDEPAP